MSKLISTPINKIGMDELNSNTPGLKNVKYYSLTKEESDSLQELYNVFNERFNILIDDYEEEILENKHLPEALVIAENLKLNSEFEMQVKALDFVIDIIKSAQKYGTYIEFAL